MWKVTHVCNRLAKRKERHVLRVVPKVQVRSDCSQCGQFGLDAGINVCLVVHVWRKELTAKHFLCAGSGRPYVVGQRGSGGSGPGNIHALFLFNDSRFVLRFTFEKVLPPLGHGKNRMNALLGVSKGVARLVLCLCS